jgi:hypothetical protein
LGKRKRCLIVVQNERVNMLFLALVVDLLYLYFLVKPFVILLVTPQYFFINQEPLRYKQK